jgi:FixJ family two-component response regulator
MNWGEIEQASARAAPVVFVVDDDDLVRESLELLIQGAGWRTETFTCAQEFLARAKTYGPSCLILDISLPDVSGLDVQERVTADRPDMPIIFITGYADVSMSVRAMKAGAIEFLMKPFNDEVVLSAIRHAIVRSGLVMARQAEIQVLRDRYASLSSRQREVMALVVEGCLNKQISGELDISEITVKAHRGKMMRKMKARSLGDLINQVGKLRSASALQAPSVRRPEYPVSARSLPREYGRSPLALEGCSSYAPSRYSRLSRAALQ